MTSAAPLFPPSPAGPARSSLPSVSNQAAMPPLRESRKAVSRFEFWPAWRFYLPVALYWGWLSLRYRGTTLPTAANPGFPGGGLVGESKHAVLSACEGHARDLVAPWICLQPEANERLSLSTAEAALGEAGLTWPLVAKPDKGCRGAGVQPVKDPQDLQRYLESWPAGAGLILQQRVQASGEAGLYYARVPGEKSGRILSLTLKYFPSVTGDGSSTLRNLILDDPRAGACPSLYLDRLADRLDEIPAPGESLPLVFSGSHCRGTIFRDGSDLVTAQMVQAFDRIADDIPGFCIGRFDIRFASFQQVQAGHGFTILEINGAGGEMTHIWDADMSLFQAWKALFRQNRLLFRFGAINRKKGAKPLSPLALYRAWREEMALHRLYPPTF